jgi:hypothetical protein
VKTRSDEEERRNKEMAKPIKRREDLVYADDDNYYSVATLNPNIIVNR